MQMTWNESGVSKHFEEVPNETSQKFPPVSIEPNKWVMTKKGTWPNFWACRVVKIGDSFAYLLGNFGRKQVKTIGEFRVGAGLQTGENCILGRSLDKSGLDVLALMKVWVCR